MGRWHRNRRAIVRRPAGVLTRGADVGEFAGGHRRARADDSAVSSAECRNVVSFAAWLLVLMFTEGRCLGGSCRARDRIPADPGGRGSCSHTTPFGRQEEGQVPDGRCASNSRISTSRCQTSSTHGPRSSRTQRFSELLGSRAGVPDSAAPGSWVLLISISAPTRARHGRPGQDWASGCQIEADVGLLSALPDSPRCDGAIRSACEGDALDRDPRARRRNGRRRSTTAPRPRDGRRRVGDRQRSPAPGNE